MASVSSEDIAKAVIKVGAVIASADGLEDREKAALVAFASQRSNLAPAVVEDLVAAAKGGLSSITDADVQTLKSLSSAQIGQLLNEGLQKIAAADGKLSDGELAALNAVWARLA